MSSSDDIESTISPRLPIPELIRLIRYSYRESEFNEVQNILMDREENMKMELKNHVRECDLLRKEVCLLNRAQGFSGLDNFKFEEKFLGSQRECEELKEKISRLVEDLKLLSDNEKKAEKRYAKVCGQYSKMVNEKNKTICELNVKINELKSKQSNSERMIGEYKDKLNILDIRVLDMTKEMEDLRHEKWVVDQTVDELRLQNLESDKTAELNKKMLESLTARIGKVEEAFASMLNVNVEDLANITKNNGSSADTEGEHVNVLCTKGEKECSGNGSTQVGSLADDRNGVFMSPGVRSTCNSSGSGSSKKDDENLVPSSGTREDEADAIQTSPDAQSLNHLPREENNGDQKHGSEGLQESGSRNLVQPISTKDGVDENTTDQTSPSAQSAYDSPRAESNGIDREDETEKLRESVSHGGDLGSGGGVPITEQLMSEEGRFGKTPHSSAAPVDIIEIYDSDDERNPGGETCNLDICSNLAENEMVYPKSVQNPSFSQTNKRKTTDWKEASLMSSNPTIKKSKSGTDDDSLTIDVQKEKEGQMQPIHKSLSCPTIRKCEENAGAAVDSQTPWENFDGISDGESTDSEGESCSDTAMENLVATLRSQKLDRKWVFGADMLKAFQEDEELCLNAICALYRQHISVATSTQASNLCEIGGFSNADAMSGCALAEYLIDLDPELRLRKSVSEVKQERPDVLSHCKSLATTYHEQLFKMYCNAEDLLFSQKYS
ncbi:hypothetical protein ACJIZ3_001910 [Penstemon smallii]|uniref:Uncharacterized protein n=1 Tax=Penstemon smallii TaxID=265156 RepID=A0ABD3U849_9LAMI